MKKSKKISSNNITLYQLPTIARITAITSAIGLSALSILGLLLFDVNCEREEFFMSLALFFFICLYDVYIYFLVFKTYLRMDFISNVIVIREFPGFHQHLIKIDHTKEIRVENNEERHVFSIIVYSQGGIKRIDSWSMGTPGFKLLFNNNARQIRRLEEFCSKCNYHLSKSN